MYCDRQPQHEGGITGVAGGRKRRWTRKEVALVEVVGGKQRQERDGVQLKAPSYARWDRHITRATQNEVTCNDHKDKNPR